MYNITQGKKITGLYGEDRKSHSHKGIDIAYPMNSDLIAALGGTVKKIANDPYGYGNYIDILSDNGMLQRYAHANNFDVKLGDIIKEGQKIGRVGSTGRSTGPHIHFEILENGRNLNPMDILANPKKYIKQTIGKPKAPDKQDVDSAILEYAQSLGKQEKSPLEDPIVNILSQNLQNIEPVQQPTTIQDIFNAKSGQRLGTFLDYLQSPEGAEMVNAIAGSINPTYGGRRGFANEIAQERIAQLNQQQADYLKQKENQTKLATDLYKELGVDKRFGKELELKGKQFDFEKTKFNTELDYKKGRDEIEDAFENRKINAQEKELAIKELDSKAERELKGAQIGKIKAETEATKKEKDEKVISLNQTASDLKDFENLFNAAGIKKFNEPLGVGRILEPVNVALRAGNIKNPDETAFDAKRSLLLSNIARNLGGEKGVLSDADIQRIGMSMPSLSDTPQQKRAKMQEIYKIIDNSLTAKGYEPISKIEKTSSKIKSIKVIE